MSDNEIQMQGWRGGDGNAAYLDKTLRYHGMELSLDESVSTRTIFMLWARAVVVAVLVWLALLIPAGLIAIGAGTTAAAGFVIFDNVVSFVAFWVVFLFTKLTEPIAEWKVLLNDRSDTVDSVYSQLRGTLRQRQTPIDPVGRRIRTRIGRGHVSSRLVLLDGTYKAYVSVFPYGTSLYLGWMMWRTRRGWELIKQFLLDVIGGMLGRNDPELLMLRTERPRAMREAVHSACREGLAVAVDRRAVAIGFGFPEGLPAIEGYDGGPAPLPPMPGQA
jgi:hypothetical protein